jgi:hypothetical protein
MKSKTLHKAATQITICLTAKGMGNSGSRDENKIPDKLFQMSKEYKLQILKVEGRRQKLEILSTRLVKENRTTRDTHKKLHNNKQQTSQALNELTIILAM